MKEDTQKYKDLMSNSKTYDYYSTVTTGATSLRWKQMAENKRFEASQIPDNYKDPEWRMPEWGTYGT